MAESHDISDLRGRLPLPDNRRPSCELHWGPFEASLWAGEQIGEYRKGYQDQILVGIRIYNKYSAHDMNLI